LFTESVCKSFAKHLSDIYKFQRWGWLITIKFKCKKAVKILCICLPDTRPDWPYVLKHGGEITKFMGDGILVIFTKHGQQSST
jgi:hypothetical protein